MYDAVITTGMGACKAQRQHRLDGIVDQPITSEEHMDGIHSANYTGATGPMAFGETLGLLGNTSGARLHEYTTMGIFNVYPRTTENGGSGGEV
jgi:hypothetical protein